MDAQASPIPQVAGRRVKWWVYSPPPPMWGPAKMTRQGPATDHVMTRHLSHD